MASVSGDTFVAPRLKTGAAIKQLKQVICNFEEASDEDFIKTSEAKSANKYRNLSFSLNNA